MVPNENEWFASSQFVLSIGDEQSGRIMNGGICWVTLRLNPTYDALWVLFIV
jgi:hypothetical protein